MLSTVAALLSQRALALAAKRKKRRPKPLFRDRFEGRDQRGWGRQWYNQRYRRGWAISNGQALHRLPASPNNVYYRPNPVLVLDHDVADVDIRATLSSSNVTARFGVVARATGYADHYACYLGPNLLRVTRGGHQTERVIAKSKMKVYANRRYRVRLRVSGTHPVLIKAKAWPVGRREPSKWQIDEVDDERDAISTAGAFGVLTQHALDGRRATVRVDEFVARSRQQRRSTIPAIAYCLVGPLLGGGHKVRAVAKTAVPAQVAFEYGADPAFASGVRVVEAGKTKPGPETAKAVLDIAPFAPSAIVYWRAIAQRGTQRVVGPTSSFRAPPGAAMPVRFAFGSCTRWRVYPRPSFEQARLKLPDFYLHQGDFGYVPHRVSDHARDTYQDHWVRMLMEPHLQALTHEVPFGFYRDDADYGINNADRHTLRPFTIAAHGELNANPTNTYFHFRCGDVAVFVIDCRRYSTGKKPRMAKRSKLGHEQKAWLKRKMRAAAANPDVGLLVLACPQAFGSDNSPESWRRSYHDEWDEMLSFLRRLDAPVLIVSGDAHAHRLNEYPQKNIDPGLPRIVEFVSAGTEQNKWNNYIDPRVVVRNAKGPGFGLVELGPEEDVGGNGTRTLTLSAIRSADGSAFWSAQYLVVRGVGIFPLGGW